MAVEGSGKNLTNLTLSEEGNNDQNKKNNEGGGDEPEEGEILEGGSDDVSSSYSQKPSKAIAATHPLEHSWDLWFDCPSAKAKASAWGLSLSRIVTFSTVEDFWGIYNNIHRPSKMGMGADLHIFKHKIEPKWEDPVCANGGRWTAVFGKAKSDTLWLNTLLAMIGEQFDHGDKICGAVINVRKHDKIALWTKNAADEAAQISIGQQWKKFLDCNESLGFIFHEDAKKLDKAAKNRYSV